VAAGCLEAKKLLMSFVFSFVAAAFLLSSGSLRFLSIGSGASNSVCTVLKAVFDRRSLISWKLFPWFNATTACSKAFAWGAVAGSHFSNSFNDLK
jgi:hypothetical protein